MHEHEHEHDRSSPTEVLDMRAVAVQVDLARDASCEVSSCQCCTSAAVGIVGTAAFAFWVCSISIRKSGIGASSCASPRVFTMTLLFAADYDFCRAPALPSSARVIAVLQRVGDESPGSDRVPDPEREAREPQDWRKAAEGRDNAR